MNLSRSTYYHKPKNESGDDPHLINRIEAIIEDEPLISIVSGMDGPNTFADYSAHPFAAGRPAIVVRTAPTLLESTASGRYQITLPTWKEITATWTSKIFSPQAQDAAALELLKQCRALNFIDTGNITAAIEAACETWASFPGNSYGQGGRTIEWLLDKYAQQLAAQ